MNYQDLPCLETGAKYTLVKFGMIGFPVKMQFELVEAKVVEYAQYKYTLYLKFKPRGKRKLFQIYLMPAEQFLLWKGYVEPVTEMWTTQNENGSKESLLCFDDEYLERAYKSVTVAPVYENRKAVA